MNRATNPPAPHVEEFRIYPEDAPAVNPGGWVCYWWPIFRLSKLRTPSLNIWRAAEFSAVESKCGEFPSLKSDGGHLKTRADQPVAGYQRFT